MQISRKCAGFILSKEAIYLYAYLDAAKVWTIGPGLTAMDGTITPKKGMTKTLPDLLALWRKSIKRYERRVDKAITRGKTQSAFDGFVSFDFNTGKIAGGTVDDKWNAGDTAGAMSTLRAYVNAGGRRLNGLVTRRREEAQMITQGVYPKASILLREREGSQPRYIKLEALPWPKEGAAPVEVSADIPDLPQKAEESSFWVIVLRLIRSLFK